MLKAVADNKTGNYILNAVKKGSNYCYKGGILPKGLVAVWASLGYEFQLRFDIYTEEGKADLIYWWLSEGCSQFRGVAESITEALLESFSSLPVEYCEENKLKPTVLMKLIFSYRHDLQNAFNLSASEGRERFWRWWFIRAAEEFQGLHMLDSEALYRYWHSIKIDCSRLAIVPPTKLMMLVHSARDDIRDAFDLTSENGLMAFWHWWFVDAEREYPWIGGSIPIIEHSDSDGSSSPLLNWSPELLFVSYIASGDRTFAIDSSLSDWEGWISEKVSERVYRDCLTSLKRHKYSIPDNYSYDSSVVDSLDDSGKGVINIVGHPSGIFGLGQDARLLSKALMEQGVTVRVYRADDDILAANMNQQVFPSVKEMLPADVTIYCMPPSDLLVLLIKEGVDAFKSRHKVGFWQWELTKFPDAADLAFDLVDQIWAISSYTAQPFSEFKSIATHVIPLPFEEPDPIVDKYNREYFGIDENAYTFYFAFDANSYISRKNPLAVVDAFQRAFARSNKNVQLVIKVMKSHANILWNECLRRTVDDPRVIIFDEVMGQDEVNGLMSVIDCFVSLHRAEGFGRLIAEALLHGKQVIASKYSGCMDYLNSDNAYLVDGIKVPVFPGDYHSYRGAEWFEPSVDDASYKMKLSYQSRGLPRPSEIKHKFLDHYGLSNSGKVALSYLDSVLTN